jgi:hypothetical protein
MTEGARGVNPEFLGRKNYLQSPSRVAGRESAARDMREEGEEGRGKKEEGPGGFKVQG